MKDDDNRNGLFMLIALLGIFGLSLCLLMTATSLTTEQWRLLWKDNLWALVTLLSSAMLGLTVISVSAIAAMCKHQDQ